MSYTTSQAIVCPVGSTAGYSNTSGGTFTPLATEILTLKLPSFAAGEEETTNSSTTTYPAPEQKAGWGKFTDGEVSANLTAADYKATYALLGKQGFLKVVVTNGEGDVTAGMTMTCPGFVKSIDGDVPITKGVSKMTIKISPTALPVLA